MPRSTLLDKILLGFLFGAVTIIFIGYRSLYGRIYERCGVTEENDYMVNADNHNEHKAKNLVDKVSVDVHYESMCTDSKSFVVDQLEPAVRSLGDRISVKLVPYGKSRMLLDNGKIKFRCQHGPRECLGNMYHSCIVDRTSNNTSLQVRVVSCLFQNLFSPVDASAIKCCRKFGLDLLDIKICVTSQEGADLLKKHGATTEPLHLSFVPAIVLNRVFGGMQYQNRILRNLTAEVCKILRYSSAIDVCP